MPTPLIIDTDPGVDDAFAIALAVNSPEVDLRAITTVYGNVSQEQTTRNALQLLALLGREDVPVAGGADCPLAFPHPHRAQYAHGSDGLGGRSDSLPEPSCSIVRQPAVELMADVLEAAEEPVIVAAIGPLTNIALLLSVYPRLTARIGRLVVMGGAVSGGNVTATAEFNVWSDPEAARRVLVESSVPTTLVPLDLTHQVGMSKRWLDDLAQSSRTGSALVSLSEPGRAHYRRLLGEDVLVLHDAIAVAEVIWPGILEYRSMPVDVECGHGPTRGMVVADRRLEPGGMPVGRDVRVTLSADLDELRGRLLDRLATSA